MKNCLNNKANHENLDLSCFVLFFSKNWTNQSKKMFLKLFHILLPHPVCIHMHVDVSISIYGYK